MKVLMIDGNNIIEDLRTLITDNPKYTLAGVRTVPDKAMAIITAIAM